MNRLKELLKGHTSGLGTAKINPQDPTETRSTNTISSTMPTHQVLSLLRKHNCKDVTHQLDLSKCGKFPVSNGGFGDVFKGKLQNGDPVAIKCLRIMVGVDDHEGQKQLRRAAHEVYVWSKCKHPNVLELIGVAQYQDRIAMVSPWMAKGSITWFLSRNPSANKYNMCMRIAYGVAHLHSSGIVHGDIKGPNILVSNDHTPKLADFGTSFLSHYTLRFTRGTGTGVTSTIRYTAPEILTEETKLTTEGDVYALGMTILEVITGAAPYDGSLEAAVVQKVLNGIHPMRPEQHMPTNKQQADAIWGLLVECWALSPSSRPTATRVADRLKSSTVEYPMIGEVYGSSASHFDHDEPIPRKTASMIALLKSRSYLLEDETPSVAAAVSNDEGKFSVSIDFGTNFSSVAYGSSRTAGGKIQQILYWPGSYQGIEYRKIPSCLLYGEDGEVLAWGLEAKNASPIPGSFLCECFKLFLEPGILRNGAVDSRLPALPPGKGPVSVIADYLNCLWYYAKQQITRETGAVVELDTAEVYLIVPARWNNKGRDILRDAAIRAGLVRSASIAPGAGKHWMERLRIMSEPEASVVHCAHFTNLHRLHPFQHFMICDASRRTISATVYQTIGKLQGLEIAEVCTRCRESCGSLSLDARFRNLVARILEHHPAHNNPTSLSYFQYAFSETDKLVFRGEDDDCTMFRYNCFNVYDTDDSTVGLINGELAIPGVLLRTNVFDPVISEVLQHIEEQIVKCDYPIDALVLVGELSESEYLLKRIDQRFGSDISMITRPPDTDAAACRGAARFGLGNHALVSSIIASRAYIMKVQLPADSEDLLKRPVYISHHTSVPICENRLQYLVRKGEALKKGERTKAKFRQVSQRLQDSNFVAILCTSDSEQVMRYSDEGDLTELCQWTLDLGVLPSFSGHPGMWGTSSFYTEFELGFELDEAEVRAVLLYDGKEWGPVHVFKFPVGSEP